MGRDGQANAPQEVVLMLCQRDEVLVLRPRIIPMTTALSRYLDVLRFAAAFTVFLSHYAPSEGTISPEVSNKKTL
jgi:hypothetical protein